MNIIITGEDGTGLAQVQSDEMVITSVQDALDLMANCGYQGANRIIVHERNLTPAFFDLKTGVAGEILQKVFQLQRLPCHHWQFHQVPGQKPAGFHLRKQQSGPDQFCKHAGRSKSEIGKAVKVA
jgi:hypothetical protein